MRFCVAQSSRLTQKKKDEKTKGRISPLFYFGFFVVLLNISW